MATVRRFEDLEIWQLARLQCRQFTALVERGIFRHDWALKDQMDRASGSVMDNIAEGFDRFSRMEFRQFLVISRGSNAEYRSQLYRTADKRFIDDNELQVLLKSSVNLGVKISNLINHIHHSPFKNKQPSSGSTIAEDTVAYQPASEEAYHLPEQFISLIQ